MNALLNSILKCEVCKDHLPLGAGPVVQLSPFSKIIIIGQAPGRLAHVSGIPWSDASGKKLRSWLDVNEEIFYDPAIFSILPMSFCYPGKGLSGDLAPRSECAPLWHSRFIESLKTRPLVLLIGQYAQKYYLKKAYPGNLTETVKNYTNFLPGFFPLPHPSPRNQHWLKINPWFVEKTIPELRKIIKELV